MHKNDKLFSLATTLFPEVLYFTYISGFNFAALLWL